ncbi:uncharacterized protein C2orf81 homolog [Colossoma macropomum]|uniref:uncharacterized protein C2orf81 homolog n=1 Tax=Colossoma macropomum TaxID=42526 RepID=UPI001863D399|nr:uncharacterized protein C2orf81 homolog [Colossoma macropomum]
MSRSAKSRGEKSRGGGSAGVLVPPVPLQQPTVTSDIIVGRLTESTWREMVEQEEGEEVVAGLIDELMDHVMDRCFQVHLQIQLVPFCVRWAREALAQTIEWRFLVRDEGENSDSDTLWTEDPEPEPSAPDSWAEGCVPVVYFNQQVRTPLLQKLLDLNVEEPEHPSNPNTSGRSHSQSRDGAHLPASEQLQPAKQDLRNIKPARTHKDTLTLSTAPSKSTGGQKKQQAQLKPLRASFPANRSQKPLQVFPPGAVRPLPESEDQNSAKNVISKKHSELRVLKRRPVRPAQKLN